MSRSPHRWRIKPWVYSGDVNLEYGGTFIKVDLSDWDNGYLDCVRVTDLDSACGFYGAVMVERVTILRRSGKEGRRALACCGQVHAARNWPKRDRASVVAWFAECLLSYGHYDPAGDYMNGDNFVFQLERDGKLRFDGREAERSTPRKLERFIRELLD